MASDVSKSTKAKESLVTHALASIDEVYPEVSGGDGAVDDLIVIEIALFFLSIYAFSL